MGIKQSLSDIIFGRLENALTDSELEDYINRVLSLKGLMLGGFTDVDRSLELQRRLYEIGYMGTDNLEHMEEFLSERITYEFMHTDLVNRLPCLHPQPRKYCLKVAMDMGLDKCETLLMEPEKPDRRKSVEERCALGEFDPIF